MKAVVKSRPEPGVEVRDVPIPAVADDEVLIRVKAAAICGSDLGIYRYTAAYHGMSLPVVMGHEFAGEVAETGALVERYTAGDRVISESVKACGRCGFCKQGMSNLCEDSTLFGIHVDGGFAEYVTVPQSLLHMMPPGMSYDEAALVEPLGNAVHFVEDITNYKPGDLVVVQGCGPIGLFSAQLFRLGGARVLVTGLGTDHVRLSIAERLGFETVNIDKVNLTGRVMELTDGKGADVAFVAVGATPAVQQAMELLKKRGLITVVGIFGADVSMDLTRLVRRELRVVGAYDARPANFPKSISLISEGKVNVSDVLTHSFSLGDAEEAFKVALDRSGGKVEFKP